MTGRPVAVIDCFGILDDDAIRRRFELGCEVKGLGRGRQAHQGRRAKPLEILGKRGGIKWKF
jgi:hypothetical protein